MAQTCGSQAHLNAVQAHMLLDWLARLKSSRPGTRFSDYTRVFRARGWLSELVGTSPRIADLDQRSDSRPVSQRTPRSWAINRCRVAGAGCLES